MAYHAKALPCVLHLDLDSFFVSVEILKNPSLKGQAVVVGGLGRRGVVVSASYEARALGIHAPMPGSRAQRLCPQAIFLPGDPQAYGQHSRLVRSIIAEEVPVYEVASIDEFYCDLSGLDRYAGGAWPFAQRLRRRIQLETGLPISMGMGRTRTLAKMATNAAKPNGELWVRPGTELAWLAPRPVAEVPMVGKQTLVRLTALGLYTLRDVQQQTEAQLEQKLGKAGRYLWRRAQGLGSSSVGGTRVRKSLGHERTFLEDVQDRRQLEARLMRLAEKSAYELRRQGLLAGCVAVKLRHSNFTTYGLQRRIPLSDSEQDFIPIARGLFHHLYRDGTPYRLIGIRLTELQAGGRPLSLFEDHPREQKLIRALDQIKSKYGEKSLKRAQGHLPPATRGANTDRDT